MKCIFFSRWHRYSVYYLTLFLLLCCGIASAAEREWKLIGPGDADQVTSLSVMTDGVVFLGTDIGGVYKDAKGGDIWKPVNGGLKNYDVTTQVIEDPTNPNILYVGTRGGFYKSMNRGALWTSIRSGLRPVARSSLSGSIGAISVDPFDPGTLYLGYGYRQSSDGTSVVQRITWDQRIYKSSDRGESWQAAGKFETATKVNQILPSALTKDLILVATDDGLYQSTDGGANLSKIFYKRTLAVLISRNDPKKVLAACGVDGVYASYNEGLTWTLSSKGLGFKAALNFPDRYCMLIGPAGSSSTVYAVNSTWGSYGGVYKSTDDGTTWQLSTASLPESWLGKSLHLNAIAVDPADSNRVYVGSSRYVYRSTDAGTTWEQLISNRAGFGWTNRGINVFGHTRFVAVKPDDLQTILIGTTDHGMVRSTDNGVSWVQSTAGMKYSDSVWDVGFCETNPNQLYAISLNTQSRFCFSISNDGGTTWTSTTSDFDETVAAYKLLVHPTDCQTIFMATGAGLLKSTSGGRSWKKVEVTSPAEPVSCIAFEFGNPAALYVGTGTNVFKTIDAGSSWQNFWSSPVQVTSILISKKNPMVVLVGVSDGRAGKGGIHRTVDGGKTWSRVLTASRLVSGIVQLSSQPETLFATTNDDNFHDESAGSGVFRSVDGGASWTSLNSGLAVLRAFNINTDSNDRVFVSANGSGAYVLDVARLSSPNLRVFGSTSQ